MLLARTIVPKIASSSGIEVGRPGVLALVAQRHLFDAGREGVEGFGVAAAGFGIHLNAQVPAAFGVDQIDFAGPRRMRSSSAQSWISISSLP